MGVGKKKDELRGGYGITFSRLQIFVKTAVQLHLPPAFRCPRKEITKKTLTITQIINACGRGTLVRPCFLCSASSTAEGAGNKKQLPEALSSRERALTLRLQAIKQLTRDGGRGTNDAGQVINYIYDNIYNTGICRGS